jgi:hypothetical protein
MNETGQICKRGKQILIMVWKARVGNYHLQFGSIEARLGCSCFLMILLAILFFLFPHQHRHPGDDGADDVIISKARNLLSVTLTSDGLLVVL